MSIAPSKQPLVKRVWFRLLLVFVGFPLLIVVPGLFLPELERPSSVADEVPREAAAEPVPRRDEQPERDEQRAVAESIPKRDEQPAAPEPSSDIEPVASPTLGVNRKEAAKGFEDFQKARGAPVNGKDNYVYRKDNLMLQIIGDEDDISQASLTITSDGSLTTTGAGAYALFLFIQNFYPKNEIKSLLADIETILKKGGTLSAGGRTLEASTTDINGSTVLNLTIKP